MERNFALESRMASQRIIEPEEPANGLDDFTNGLALLLGLDDDKAVKLAELLEDKLKAMIESAEADHTRRYKHEFDSSDW